MRRPRPTFTVRLTSTRSPPARLSRRPAAARSKDCARTYSSSRSSSARTSRRSTPCERRLPPSACSPDPSWPRCGTNRARVLNGGGRSTTWCDGSLPDMVEDRDPAIVRSPFGPEIDGRRLLGAAVGFGRSLRVARLSIDLGAAVDFARALTLVDIADREQVRAAGAAIFVRRRDDRPVYDAALDRWWRRRGSRFSDE